jgi:hypothetical protein
MPEGLSSSKTRRRIGPACTGYAAQLLKCRLVTVDERASWTGSRSAPRLRVFRLAETGSLGPAWCPRPSSASWQPPASRCGHATFMLKSKSCPDVGAGLLGQELAGQAGSGSAVTSRAVGTRAVSVGLARSSPRRLRCCRSREQIRRSGSLGAFEGAFPRGLLARSHHVEALARDRGRWGTPPFVPRHRPGPAGSTRDGAGLPKSTCSKKAQSTSRSTPSLNVTRMRQPFGGLTA